MKRRAGLGVALGAVLLVAGVAGVLHLRRVDAREAALAERLAQRQPWRGTPRECPAANALNLLVLGQSNAANHGQSTVAEWPPQVLVRGPAGCAVQPDPLPGGTGAGGSLWSHLPRAMRDAGDARVPLVTLLAVDDTAVDDWTRPASPLRAALQRELQAAVAAGHPPDLVLWQQGEADARRGTGRDAYLAAFTDLVGLIRGAGVTAPVVVARSTRCRSEPSAPVRDALALATQRLPGVLPGPDTDTLDGPLMRHDGCHFSTAGQEAAARLWAQVLEPLAVPAPTSHPAGP